MRMTCKLVIEIEVLGEVLLDLDIDVSQTFDIGQALFTFSGQC